MKSLITAFSLAGVAAAQITTSFVLWKGGFGTDKIGFYASVIDVQNSRTALAFELDNGTDPELPSWVPSDDQTFTVGPNLFEQRVRIGSGRRSENITNEMDLVHHCDLPASLDPNCTVSYGPTLARQVQCQSATRISTGYDTQTHTYSGRLSYSAGVETVTRTYIFGPNTRGFPTWCSDRSYVPSSGWEYPVTIKKEEMATYQVIITAGQEKLSPTAGGSVSVSGPTPTGSGGGGGVGSIGAAMPMRTAAPMIAGLGAAIAVFL